MAKTSDLMNRFGSNVAESMGAGRQGRVAVRETPKADPEDGTERLRSAVTIEVDRIAADPNQPRTDFDEGALDRLAESLKEHGQLQPIAVRWSDEAGRYLIVSGERRWRAALKAGRKTIDAVIVDPRSESQILELQLIENCLREDLRPIEQAKAFRTLMDRNGWSGDQLARTLHMSDASVFRALALLSLPDSVQSHVESGGMAPATAYEVSKLEDPAAQREVAERVVAEKLSRAETVEAVRRASKPKAVGKGRGVKSKLPTERTIRTAGGLKVAVSGRKGFEVAAWIEALRDALHQAEAHMGSVLHGVPDDAEAA
jgi:ParB family chromosome partitioning protein